MPDAAAPDLDRFCVSCGYNLRSLQSDRCPECGTAFDVVQSTAPQIPWSYRRTLGRRRAFWKTVKLVTFKTKTFARDIERPVSLADAKSFRRVVAVHAYVPIAVLAAAAYLMQCELLQRPWYSQDPLGSTLLWIGLPVLLASIWPFLIFAMGVPSYFFHPAWLPIRQQNRAVAMSYYACAPWAYLAFTLAAITALLGMAYAMDAYVGEAIVPFMAIIVAIWILAGLQIVLIWFLPHQLLRRTMHCGVGRLVLMDLIFPLAIVLMAVFTVGLSNLLYWAGSMVVLSLT